MAVELSSLSLFVATPEQITESRRRTFVQWGRGMTEEEYLARDAFTDKHENAQDGRLITWVLTPRDDPSSLAFVSSCETFRREGLLLQQPSSDNGKDRITPQKVTCYGIASVFTPASFRGNGYARHMMRLLHWVIADASRLPRAFPEEWGAPPVNVACAGDGLFSVLWSDVGTNFYSRCGPAADQEGWIVRDAVSTTWDVRHESPISDQDPASGWTWLDEPGVLDLWEKDANHIASILKLPDNFRVSFTFLPNRGVAAFQHRRNIHFLNQLVPRIEHWGIMAEPRSSGAMPAAFATWTFDARPPGPKTLLITRLDCRPDDFENLFAMVTTAAKRQGMEKIEIYNLPEQLQPAATKLGGTTGERDEHLSAFKWYGTEDPRQVAWLLNERTIVRLTLVFKAIVEVGRGWCNTGQFVLAMMDAFKLDVFPLSTTVSFFVGFLKTQAGVHVVEFQHAIIPSSLIDDPVLASQLKAPPAPAYSLTAILPVTRASIASLEESLTPLLEPSHLREIILLCTQDIISQARSILRQVVSSGPDCPDILLQTPTIGLDRHTSIIRAATQASTEWVLLMDHEGLARESNYSREILLKPPAVSVPFGPRGVRFSAHNLSGSTIIESNSEFQPALYLLPPFVLPASSAMFHHQQTADIWAALGKHIAESGSGVGGIVFGTGLLSHQFGLEVSVTSSNGAHSPINGLSNRSQEACPYHPVLPAASRASGVFVILLPKFEDFLELGPLACMLQEQGHDIQACVYENPGGGTIEREDQQFALEHCNLTYVSLCSRSILQSPRRLGWLREVASRADVLLALREEENVTNLLDDPGISAVLVRLSRADIPYSTWMGSLSLVEWQNWNTPRIDISIITKDRPRSLARLLTSLSKGIFFGDPVDLRLNLEQTSDLETMKMAENLSWSHGSIFLHHRIIQGGLLPAVVESWYPRSNDTYGLLLEDDIELSPLFYAWAKMSLLRYRYGHHTDRSLHMFGISLYQQKNVELPPEGRRLFNAHKLFNTSGIPNPNTPYLSPIPCSWGAIYFPEHWREFHAYLSIRLSEYSMKIDQPIVPNVRSNKWTKSWKKYFIELVYLRGYVMLYPNYPEFISLSTNHLEVGSHVKVRTKEKQKQFIVPLMQLPSSPSISLPPTIGLLDLPDGTLPQWNALPVLNLTGGLTTLETLVAVGHARRTELTGCTAAPAAFDIQELMCIRPKRRKP
ncbi:hypothetical protein D9615_003652 [Tricholomella constricta]|uniref:LYC1 C-terminal domain-containing protein n=1 Tax=Tricholomella constricta TaxID=117010 RepID=A0A8H5M7L9_9AGAR|nr:hypothetical protein D9615_003652 [Tricholomella constricta]